ncbi:hypothetical protein CK203_016994 [Vitis vinifera]|uniref:GAG-pre-integrase domain-containing protein n=1 Tax=Vitis vinifera TaxID=29760 RepID=A0A438JNI8_VITVI|nr:hypothetical protein CK203_016994 [Vitis vinifera]
MKRADAKCDHIKWSRRLDKNLHRSMVVNLEDTLWQRQNRVGAEYNSFVVTMTTRPADISLEQVHIMLLTHENSQKQHLLRQASMLGATHHITHDLTSLNNTNPFSGADKVLVSNANSFFVKDLSWKQVLLQCQLDRGLYKVSSSDSTASSSGPLFCTSINPSAFVVWKKNCRLWHSHLGHLADPTVNRVLQLFNEPPIISNSVCESCQTAKSHRLPFVVSNSRAIKSFSLLHIDLWVLLQ